MTLFSPEAVVLSSIGNNLDKPKYIIMHDDKYCFSSAFYMFILVISQDY